MKKTVRLALVVLGLVGAGVLVQQQRTKAAIPQAAPARLPLVCRLRGHGWKLPKNSTQTPIRKACQKCQRIDVPMPS